MTEPGINVESIYIDTPEGRMALIDYLQHNSGTAALEARVAALEARLEPDT